MGKPAVMRHRVLEKFRELDAFNIEKARAKEELEINTADLEKAFEYFEEKGVIKEFGGGYYLDGKYKDNQLKRLFSKKR
jgi:hypothetical protein